MNTRWIFPTAMVVLCVGFLTGLVIARTKHPVVTPQKGTLVTNFPYQSLPMLGKPNAPVKIVEFADFKCPICRDWHNGNPQQGIPAMFPQVYKTYIKTGKADLYFATFPVISNTQNDMEAGESIAAQSNQAFWTYYNEIYNHQQSETKNWTTIPFMTKFIKKYVPGVNVKTVVQAMKNQKYATKIQDQQIMGQQSGVQGTPTLFINGEQVSQSFNYSLIQSMINADLAKK